MACRVFTQESSRDQHQVYCKKNESVRVEMPKQGSTVEFKDGQNQFRVPFIIYADFELILELMDPMKQGSPNPSQPYANEVNQHTPSGWCVYSKFAYRDTGLYRGPAHSLCNLRYKIPSYIPVVFHNLSGYDTHLFIRELGAHTSEMGVIMKNKDYISFSIKVPVDSYIDRNGEEKDKLIELRFIESFKFISSSLDSLTKNLVRGGKKLFGFEDYFELQYDLLTRKGVYPYEYVNSWD